ncbi:MAG TPA: ABC transporter ATP-binding protein [Euryarchaeota archaeon]|nr:high-affinity zinc uptake system ATP-binding protein ZnuC [archaeon BMS3Bbin15]HDL16076.1 ABC transporter ATP-binding protein [Euryarchaeota archaeon]
MDREIVSLKNLYVYFNNTVSLEDINLSIKQNTFLGIIGPNGGGKTTLLRVILGLIKPDRGEVRVFGKTPEEGRKFIGYLPQYNLFDHSFPLNVFEVVLMGRYRGIFKDYSKEDKAAVINALKTVGMFEFKDRQIGRLSGGQLQRVFIARAIVREPKLLLLDEPTASIDPEMQRAFYDLLLKLKERMAVVLITHDVGAVSVYVDEIACLNRRLFYHGPKEEGLDKIEEMYRCPIDLIAHGVPHRVLRGH